MGRTSLSLLIRVEPNGPTVIALEGDWSERSVAAVIAEVIARLGLTGDASGWTLEHLGSTLASESLLGDVLRNLEGTVELVIRAKPTDVYSSPSMPPPASAPYPQAPPSVPYPAPGGSAERVRSTPQRQPKLAQEESAFDSNEDEEADESTSETLADSAASQTRPLDEEEQSQPGMARSKKRSRSETRRATVRHFSRMNPEMLYPLLVIFSKDMIEQVIKKHTSQRSSQEFSVNVEETIEVEPVLPGCDCYPPRMTTRLTADTQTLTFRVAPRVLGKLDGACVLVRQGSAQLAEIALDIKVSRKLWVVVSGMFTLALPLLSALLKHFGVDFEARESQGSNLYIAGVQFLMETISPLTLTFLLAAVTASIWWMTGPRRKDVFWHIQSISAARRLEQINGIADADPARAIRELEDLIAAAPEEQKAHLRLAELHYENEDYEAALKHFGDGFQLGTAGAKHYAAAALAASRLGQTTMALQILVQAEKRLPPKAMTATMIYNMACYRARLGQLNDAMICLTRAIGAGFRKCDTLKNDADLDPLRGRHDFESLLASIGAAAVTR